MKNPLFDSNFLKQLDEYPHKTVYAKIILLSFNEEPVQEIQGRISAGSVNVDGASAIRRTCSLTMLTNQEKIDNIYWGLKNKFKLEIGLENFINPEYPEIIWFKQGLFVITGLSESLNSTNHTINISGKDKGCLINGEVGGSIPSTTNFSKMNIDEKQPDNSIITTEVDIPIKEIIKNILISFGGESLHNIVINDIDNYGMELLSYKGDTPLYMLYDEEAGMVTNMTFNGKQSYIIKGTDQLVSIDNKDVIKYNTFVDQKMPEDRTRLISGNGKEYSVIKFTKDESVGYRKTELTYPGDLIANPGESITSVLDKIKNMFSTFEYFYDIEGKFVFQKKKTYVQTSWNNITIVEDEIYVKPSAGTSATIYSFEDNQLLTAISRQPTLNNLKNDFAIQGVRKSATGADILIHMRYAIADKPVYYKAIDNNEYYSYEFVDYQEIKNISLEQFETGIYFTKDKKTGKYKQAIKFVKEEIYYQGKIYNGIRYDWRELIYQMALDYFKYNQEDDFFRKIKENNKDYYPSGKTGYEIFYTDLQGYWRTLYNPQGDKENYDSNTFWHKNVEENPAVLDFWFDFLDTTSQLGEFSISTIGHRPKAVNDTKVTAIYYKQVPQVLFLYPEEINKMTAENLKDYYNLSGYNFIQITSAYEKYFSISSRGKSAQDALDDLLYQHLYCNENITLTSIPIYYLQPNHRIYVRDNHTNINGEYLLNKITIPLTYNGTSSISAQLAPDRIY